jgi:SAM-dependent methyltransferase
MTPDGLKVSHLKLEEITQTDSDHILYGFFKCENPECRVKYPIIDGVPCIVKPDEQYWWSDLAGNIEFLDTPRQVKKYVLQLLNDNPMNTHNHEHNPETSLSSYDDQSLLGCFLDNHYGEFEPGYEPQYPWADYRPYWNSVITAAKPKNEESYDLSIDLGCSVGRYTFELARMSRFVVGLDLRFKSILAAAQFQRQGGVVYNRRRRALLFEEVKTDFEPPQNVLFIAGNAIEPPFLKESFDLLAGLNLLDNIKMPRIILGQINALLRNGGILILGSPYDWRLDICKITEWLESEMMSAPEMVRGILEGKVLPEYSLDYTIESETDIIWPLKNHDRYWSTYNVNLIRAIKN